MDKLKQLPEDFIVEEKMNLKAGKSGKYAYFTLKKRNWSSLKAVEEIARRAKVRSSEFSMAGQKDKNAITTQYISVIGKAKQQIERISIKDIKIQFIGFGDKKIGLGDLEGNSFRITIRNLEKLLNRQGKLLIPNYFGEQRFGGNQRPNTAIVGKYLIKKDFEHALKAFLGEAFEGETNDYKEVRAFIDKNWGKWEEMLKIAPGRMFFERIALSYLVNNKNDYVGAFNALPKQLSTMFIHAYQSLIWNKVLYNYIKENYEYFEVDYCAGKLAFPLKEVKNFVLPVVNPNTKITDKKIGNIIDDVLKEESVSKEDFVIKEIPALSAEQVTREAFINVDFKVGKPEQDELNKGKIKQTVEFFLPKGSYATIALKALLGNA